MTFMFAGLKLRFLRAVQSVFIQKRRLEMADLYEAPLTNFGADAVNRWFSEEEVNEMIEFTNRLKV
jgi:type I restriction enzyme R subunit